MYSGITDEFCQAGCLSDYGTCKGISITDSWRKAQKDGKTDEKGGGQYYFDSENNLFWTWDTPEMIARKFKEIVAEKKLGGVMAWGLSTWRLCRRVSSLSLTLRRLRSPPWRREAVPSDCMEL